MYNFEVGGQHVIAAINLAAGIWVRCSLSVIRSHWSVYNCVTIAKVRSHLNPAYVIRDRRKDVKGYWVKRAQSSVAILIILLICSWNLRVFDKTTLRCSCSVFYKCFISQIINGSRLFPY